MTHSTDASLLEAGARGRLASSYLLEGSAADTLAASLRLARAALCERAKWQGCGLQGYGQCGSCRAVSQLRHPDVRVFRPRAQGQRNLPVETVRTELLPFTRHAPFQGSKAFVIISEADTCFPAAYTEGVNALLKTLEEPRVDVHFLLTAARPHALLATVRSRCQLWRLADVARPMERATAEAPDSSTSGSTTSGSRAAASLDSDPNGKAGDKDASKDEAGGPHALLARAVELDEGIDRWTLSERVTQAERLSKQDNLQELLLALVILHRDMLAHLQGAPPLMAKSTSRLGARATELGGERVLGRAEALLQTLPELSGSANKQLLLDDLISRLAS